MGTLTWQFEPSDNLSISGGPFPSITADITQLRSSNRPYLYNGSSSLSELSMPTSAVHLHFCVLYPTLHHASSITPYSQTALTVQVGEGAFLNTMGIADGQQGSSLLLVIIPLFDFFAVCVYFPNTRLRGDSWSNVISLPHTRSKLAVSDGVFRLTHSSSETVIWMYRY
jgi:hypothetical protein